MKKITFYSDDTFCFDNEEDATLYENDICLIKDWLKDIKFYKNEEDIFKEIEIPDAVIKYFALSLHIGICSTNCLKAEEIEDGERYDLINDIECSDVIVIKNLDSFKNLIACCDILEKVIYFIKKETIYYYDESSEEYITLKEMKKKRTLINNTIQKMYELKGE